MLVRPKVFVLLLLYPVSALAGTEVTGRVHYDYDELGRVIAERGAYADSRMVTYTYDANGNVESMTEGAAGQERTTILSYDGLDRLVTATDALQQVVRFQYDSGDRLIQVTDARGNATRYVYDGFGQLWSQISPDTGTTAFAYGANGLMTSMTRAGGQVTSYGYDGMGRLISVASGGQTHAYAYDSCSLGKGRLCKVTDAAAHGTLEYAYNAQGQLLSQKQKIGASATVFDQSYSYDGLGRLTGIAYPSGVSVAYAYQHGQLSAMTATIAGTTHNVATGFSHQPFGAVSGWTYGNGLVRKYSRNEDGQLIGLSSALAGDVRQSLTYGYSASNEITAITNAANSGLNQAFAYDKLSRLTAVTASNANQSFAYDSNGNRVSHTWGGQTDSYSVLSSSNKLQAITGARPKSFTLDANGNVTAAPGAAYAYDPFNRLSSVVKGGLTTNYWVNGLGQRTRKEQGSAATTTNYVYGLNGQLSAEHNGGSGAWKTYLRLGGEIVGVVKSGDNQVYAVHSDHLGRPELVTSAAKVNVWKASNYAFDRAVTLDTLGGLNLGFPGQYYDAESGLWHNGFRDYDAAAGRYVQSDPIGLFGGINTYAYVAGNPLSFVDPAGLAGFGVTAGGSAEAGVGRLSGGVTASAGGGVFWGSGLNAGGYASGGVISKGPTAGTTWTAPASDTKGKGVVGGFLGAGAGVYVTNAECASELKGSADTTSLNISLTIVPIKFSLQFGVSGSTWIGGITFGPGVGASASDYPTKTVTVGR